MNWFERHRDRLWEIANLITGVTLIIIFMALILVSYTGSPIYTIQSCANLTKGQTLWVNASEALSQQQIWNYTSCQSLIANISSANTA